MVLALLLTCTLYPFGRQTQAAPLAQQGEQNVDIIYGESLRFTLDIADSTTFQSASVLIEQDGTSETLAFPAVPISTGFEANVAVEALDLPPFAEIDFRWQLADQSGQVSTTDLLVYRYEDNTLPIPWRQITANNITVYIADTNDAVAESALRSAQQAVRQQSQTLQIDASNIAITIYVYPQLASMAASLRLHGDRVQDWVAAYAIPEQNLILVSTRGQADFEATLDNDIQHEIAHLLMAEAVGSNDVPAWFNEGFALNTASSPDVALDEILDEALREGTTLPLSSLCDTSFAGLAPQSAALAYAQSASFYRYLLERYGPSQIRAIVDGYRSGLGCSQAVQRALGVSLEQLDGQWLTAARREAAQDSDAFSTTPLVFVWIISILVSLLFATPEIPRRISRRSYR